MNRLIYIGDIMERARAYVQPPDLALALKSFKEKTGVDATQIEVNPKIARVIDGTAPEDLEIIEHGGCATWEIRLASSAWDGNFPPVKVPSPIAEPSPQKVSRAPRLKKAGGQVTIPPAVKKPLQRVKKGYLAIKRGNRDVAKLGGNGAKGGAKVVGRPRLKGRHVSRWTKWRRKREKQGVLL